MMSIEVWDRFGNLERGMILPMLVVPRTHILGSDCVNTLSCRRPSPASRTGLSSPTT